MNGQMRVNSGELRAGDKVHTHGAVVLLTGTPATYTGQNGLTVYSWGNAPVIQGAIWTFPNLTEWTIQGNRLAQWDIERPDYSGETLARQARRDDPYLTWVSEVNLPGRGM